MFGGIDTSKARASAASAVAGGGPRRTSSLPTAPSGGADDIDDIWNDIGLAPPTAPASSAVLDPPFPTTEEDLKNSETFG